MSEDYITKDKTDLLETIRLERENLTALLQGLTESQMVEPGVEASWSIKDILAHIAAWERVAIDIVQPARNREPLDTSIPKIFESIDNFNAEIYKKNKDLTLAEVQAEFEAVHQDFLNLIESLSWEFILGHLPFEGAEEFTIQNMISSNTHWHYIEHAASVQKWLKS